MGFRADFTPLPDCCYTPVYMWQRQYHTRIEINPKVLVGKPVIRGTRIPVELILKMLAQGIGFEEILKEYPRLTREDILAAIDYAHDAVSMEEIHELELA